MFYQKNISVDQELFVEYLKKMFQCVKTIKYLLEENLQLCKKHSQIMVALNDLDQSLYHIRSFQNMEIYDSEAVAKFSKIHVYLNFLARKRLYRPGDQKFADLYQKITNILNIQN